jgi:hypothetical protein
MRDRFRRALSRHKVAAVLSGDSGICVAQEGTPVDKQQFVNAFGVMNIRCLFRFTLALTTTTQNK